MSKFYVIFFFFALRAAYGGLTWGNPSQEFQRRPEDRELAVNFAFKNTGDQEITITKVTSSCGCTTTNLPKKTYLPGEGGNLTAIFTFGGRRGAQAKSITVVTDDQKTTQLAFKCMITDEPVAIAPSFLFWRVGDPAQAKQVKIMVAKVPSIHIIAVASSNPRISATLVEQEEGKFGVDVCPVDTSKPESAEIFVQTDYPTEGPKVYVIQVRVK